MLGLATTILTEQKHAALIICAKVEALMNIDSQMAWMTLTVWPEFEVSLFLLLLLIKLANNS